MEKDKVLIKDLYPKIEIDYTKCTTPFACKLCLRACPQGVFAVTNVRERKLTEEDPNKPGTYKAWARCFEMCTGCEDCIRVCPVNALKITYPDTLIATYPERGGLRRVL